ncbi:MAG: CARDB domain-containing protein, partial [Methanosarcinaceae archaeon]
MKALYLLCGLLLLTTISIAAPPAPFLVEGWVINSDGSPVNDPEVNLTNLNTGEKDIFTTKTGTNYYQHQLILENISTGHVFRFNVTDGVTHNITNRTVTAGDLNSGGIFGFELILVSTSPGITGYFPDSPVNDVENTMRTFNITINQVADVTWLINGIKVQEDYGVTGSYYTNTNSTPGIRNVSAVIINENGTASKTWIWEVTSSDIIEPTANSTANSTAPFIIYGWVLYENGSKCIGPEVNVSNPNTNMWWPVQTLDFSHYYQCVLDIASINTGDLIRINVKKDGAIRSIDHIITWDDIDNGLIEVNINEEGVLPDLAVTQITPPQGWLIANNNNTITAEIRNDGTAITSGFNVSLTVNGTLIDVKTVASMVTGATKYVSFNWVPDNDGSYLLVVEADPCDRIDESNETNNHFSMTVDIGQPDFEITAIKYDPSSRINDTDPVTVTATISNMESVGGRVNVDFSIAEKCGEGYLSDKEFASNSTYVGAHGENTISAVWNATCGLCSNEYKIRAAAGNSSKTTNLTVVSSRDFTVLDINQSTDTAILGDNVTCNITVMNVGIRTGDAEIKIIVNNSEKRDLIYTTSRTLEPGIPGYIVFDWNTGSTNMGGDCNINVEIDPYRKISEINETNNEMIGAIFVNGTDLVCNIKKIDHSYHGGIINISACIGNLGFTDATNFSVGFYDYDNSSDTISLIDVINISNLPAGDYICVNATLDLLDINTTNYDIQVRINHCDNPENNLNNNYNHSETVVMSPWEVSLSMDKTIKEGEDLIITATVTNLGTRGGNASVRFYSDHPYLNTALFNNTILFNETWIYVDGNSTKYIDVVWNARPLLSDPMGNLTSTRNICASVDTHVSDKYEIIIETADLTIKDIIVDQDYNVTIVVKNNENRDINSTFWFYDVNHTVYDVNYQYDHFYPYTSETLSINHPNAFGMSIYFDIINIKNKLSADKCSMFNVTDNNGYHIRGEKKCEDGSSMHASKYWTNWSTGDTINLEYYRTNVTIKSASLLEYRSLSLNASETKNITVPWNTKIGEDHTIWVQISNETQHKNVSLNIDLAVTDISANNETLDEKTETITATISNIGYGNASDFIVKFFMDDPNCLFHSTNITKLASNTSTTVTANWTADTWNEKEKKATLNHTIWVEIECCENSDINIINDRNSRLIQVNPTRDFSVTNLSLIQDTESKQTKINATIKNFGEAGSANVSIHAEKDGKIIPIYFASHPVDAKRCIDVQWDAGIVGHFDINGMVDPDNRILETNESNNNQTLSVYIEAPDLSIVNLTIDDLTPLEGNTVNITAEIANTGDRPADANLTVYDRTRAKERLNKLSVYPSRRGIISKQIRKNNATAMRLYLNYKISEGYLRLYDNKDKLISFIPLDNDPFIGWTEWVVGDVITVELETFGEGGHLQIVKNEYLTADDIINRTHLPQGTTNVTVSWNIPTAGERTIVAIIDSDNNVLEHNEDNNCETGFIVVQGSDLIISDLQLRVNGSEINDTGTIADGVIVNISANITNIGIKPTANDFNVTLVCDNIHGIRMEIINVTIPHLYPDTSANVNATWNATVGDYTITAIADPEDSIFETSNSNNALSKNVVVLGADLLINATTVRISPPDGAGTNAANSLVYDTDTVVINATIKNQGLVRADNFSAYIFYEYEYVGKNYRNRNWMGKGEDRWINKGYDGAECICIHITDTYNLNGRLIVFDGNGSEIARPNESCWIPVMGDTVNINYPNVHGLGFTVDFYAGNITKFENLHLDIGESMNISMVQLVDSGDHPVRVLVDPENIVPGDPDYNNYYNFKLHALPSRDLIPEMYLTRNGSGINTNDTIRENDIVTVDVDIRMDINESDPYNEYRKGTVDVDIIDEHEWIDAVPRFELASCGYAQVIGYPGADAIRVHFKELDVSSYDVVEIRDRNGTLLCTLSSYTSTSPWLDRDEIYLYKVRKQVAYGSHLYRYIACEIDEYQYRMINHTTVNLTANEIVRISTNFTPDAGNHTITTVIDPDDKIVEIIESNNEVNETIFVTPRRDPAVVDISFSPEMPYPGTAVNVTANITNYGNMTTNVTVDLYAMKYEYRPCESPHPDKSKPIYDVFEKDITTYPEANRTGVHFTRISTIGGVTKIHLYVNDRNDTISENYYGFEKDDVWAWVKGDVLKIDTKQVCSFHSCIWGFSIDTVAHHITLNQTTVTLKPGETASVTGTLQNVRIGNRSFNYTITAVVDKDNIVFETNESNNVANRKLFAKCPDLKVNFNPPDKAVIINTGTGLAENVEVRLWREEKYHKTEQRYMIFSPEDGEPDAVRVHFEKLKIHEGTLRVWNNTDLIYTLSSGNYPDTWVEVEGKECIISYDSADVKIDRYEHAYDIEVGDIQANDRKNEEIPWTGYEVPYNLTIDADPGNEVIESNEDNNNVTISIHADIVPKLIYFSKPTEDKLIVDLDSTIEVTIINDGTAPAGEFDVTLDVKDENGTVIFNEIRNIS